MRVVVAASWGSPACWGRARYVLGDPGWGTVVEVESRTSLLAVLEYAGRLGSVEALVVGVPLSAGADRLGGPAPLEVADGVLEAAGALEGSLRDWMRGEGIPAGLSIVSLAQSSGVFRGRTAGDGCTPTSASYEFRMPPTGSPFESFAAALLPRLLEAVAGGDPGEPLALLVDLTHGVNYTAAAALEAARLVALAASAALGVEVRRGVFNSDPYPGPGAGIPRLRVWRVYYEVARPSKSAHELARLAARLHGRSRNPLKAWGSAGSEDARRASEALSRGIAGWPGTAGILEALAAAVAFNAPLAVASLPALVKAPLRGAARALGEAYREALHSGDLSRSGGRVVVEWRAHPVLDAFKYVAALSALWEYASRQASLEGLDPERALREGVTLDQLGEIASRVDGPLEHVTAREIGEIKVKLAARECGHPLAGRLIRQGAGKWVKPKRVDCRADKRNFAAHAGLEKSLVEAYMPPEWRPGEARLRYIEECRDTLVSILRGLLAELA